MFALGAVSTLTPKMAGRAGLQAQLVADNIRALIDGGQLQMHEPSSGAILVTFGPDGGAAQLPGQDETAGAKTAAQFKSRDMMVDRFADMFRITLDTYSHHPTNMGYQIANAMEGALG